jgi:O-antigen/teichoic acid export membrane protein
MFRDVVKGIAKNSSVLMFQQLVTWGSTFTIMMILPRYLGPLEWGWIFLSLSIVQIFSTIVSYGGSYFVAKEVARDPAATGQVMINSIMYRFLFSILSIVIIVGYSFWAGYSSDIRLLIYIYAAGLTWQSGSVVLYACCQGHEVLHYTSISAIVERVLQLLVVIVTVNVGANVFVIAVLTTLSSLIGFLVLVAYTRRLVPSIPAVQWNSVFAELRGGLPYFMFGLFGVIYYRIDSVMLSKMVPELVVGWYGAAYRLFEALNFPYVLTIALYPVLSRLWKTENEMHTRTMLKSLELVILVAILVTVAMVAYAHDVITLFYGAKAYQPSIILLQLLCGGLIFLYVNMVVGTTLMASDRQTGMMILALALIPINVILNLVMIPYCQEHFDNGAIGASVATALTELSFTIGAILMLPSGSLSGFRLSILPKGLMAGLVMAMALWLAGAVQLPWFLSLCVGSLVFFATLVLVKTLEPSEEAFLKELVSTRIARLTGRSLKG